MKNAKPYFIFVFLTLAVLLTGCGNKLLPPADPPPPLPEIPMIAKPIRLAVVLGSGGSRGLAHIGVLEELEKARIPIDLIVGSSAGSFIGCLYADCPNAVYLKALLPLLKKNALLDINIIEARYGLSQGRSMRRFLDAHLDAEYFEELKIPLVVVATDLHSGELVPIGGGPLVPAVEASCSIPFLFSPVELHGRILIDGSITDPIPVRLARQLGADIIIAVDLQELLPQRLPSNLFEVAIRSIEITFLWQSEEFAKDADILIRPNLGDIGSLDDEYNQIIYQAGKEAARKVIPTILEILYKRNPELAYEACKPPIQNLQ